MAERNDFPARSRSTLRPGSARSPDLEDPDELVRFLDFIKHRKPVLQGDTLLALPECPQLDRASPEITLACGARSSSGVIAALSWALSQA
ncbi:hypothetical protein BH23PLA1_BH23PLA1_41540 [soil metagenome]